MTDAFVMIKLGDTEYRVPQLNMGQLRRISRSLSKAAREEMETSDVAYDVVQIAMERADPRVLDFDQLTPSFLDVGPASNAILAMSGFKLTADPQTDQGQDQAARA